MDLKFNKTKIKSIDNWYYKKNKQTIDICNHIEQLSINNNILQQNKLLIEAFKNQQIDDINEKYKKKIENYNNKKNINKNVKKRNDALEFVIKNKNFLESIGEDKNKIKKYCDDQYSFINKKYLCIVDFIDT